MGTTQKVVVVVPWRCMRCRWWWCLLATLTSLLLVLVVTYTSTHIMASTDLLSVDFEVFGKVQGVFFRKFTQKQARSLGLVGWVKNTRTSTVVGVVEGAAEEMVVWLRDTGSPQSRIDRAVFSNRRSV